ncbi:MAG TPA: cupredoxin domain-containing protein [Candidatus Eisenbacteria bacterium]|nr:cupredoxin domain-containing protein [Candidatus Eisenbacteria bacterium]
MRRSSRLAWFVGSLAALSFAGILGCASGNNRPPVTLEAMADSAGVQRVNVTLHSFYFEPSRIVVRAGHPVELVLHNNSLLVPHNFTIVDSTLSVARDVGRKGTEVVKFTPEHPGEYEFFCHVGSHAKKGMKGVLVVNP